MKLRDGSIVNNGKLTFISLERFINEVCQGSVCLSCAQPLPPKNKTREHIIPDWVLSKFELHGKHITLPNGARIKYGEYTIPCCESCNGLYGKKIERPLQQAFSKGFDGINEFIDKKGPAALFVWLAWIFLKTHLKDKGLRMHLDHRKSGGSIADGVKYDWHSFHHIYCLARAPYTEARIDSYSMGSLLVVPLIQGTSGALFDFIDLSNALTLGIAMGSVGIVAVFGDGGAVNGALSGLILEKIEGPLNEAQFRELIAHFACCNFHLKNPPKFGTISDLSGETPPLITPTYPIEDPEFETPSPLLLGRLMDLLLGPMMEKNVNIEDYRPRLQNGELSFLFNSKGHFIKNDNRMIIGLEPNK